MAHLEHFERLLMENVDLKQGFDFGCFQDELKLWHSRITGNIISLALETTYGNQVKAAQLLGITPRALRYHLKKAGEEGSGALTGEPAAERE